MTTFFWRLALIIFFFTVGILLSTLFGAPYLLTLLLFLTTTVWTLILPFKKTVAIIVPMLLIFDVLADGRIGTFFFTGFLLCVATAFFSVRIQKDKFLSAATLFYVLLTSFFACLNLAYQGQQLVTLGTAIGHIIFAAVLFLPLLAVVTWLETKLDTSFREAAQKIR
jgi:hypothetical protein